MLKLPFVNYKKAFMLSMKSGSLLKSRCCATTTSELSTVRVQCKVCVKKTRECERLRVGQRRSLLASGSSVQPSTHGGGAGVWSNQGQTTVVRARHLSTSTALRSDDHDDEITGKSENGSQQSWRTSQRNRRGPSRGLRRAGKDTRDIKLITNRDSLSESETPDKWAMATSAGSGQSPKFDNDVDIDDTDEHIDIHSPRGLESESANEFDAQYFKRLQSNTFSSNNVSDVQLENRTDSSVGEEHNEFDQQYFGEATNFDTVQYTNENGSKYNTQRSLTNADFNEIDKQYFGESDMSFMPPIVKKKGLFQNKGESKPVFLDTNYSEENILEDLKRRNEMQLLKEASEAMSEPKTRKYKPHENAAPISFDQESHTDLHADVQFLDDKSVTINSVPEYLRKKLKEERIQKEQDLNSSTSSTGHLQDIEPEVAYTISSLKKKKMRIPPAASSAAMIKGTVDPEMASSNKPCSGCGALLQCGSVNTPGFMPKEKFVPFLEDVAKGKHDRIMKAVCVRCWNLLKQREALHVNVIQEDYANIIKTIRKKRALVVILVDLLDFPCSIIPNLKDILGNKHVCLVGNKLDLLPVDSKSRQYTYDRIQKQLLQACVDSRVCSKDNVREILLISAKTGYGVERLISKLHKNWGTQGDVYILGTANVGKSTLFNRLLESDYCKSKASYLLGKATISRWPGTTLNLLRFPILSLSKVRVVQRAERLKAEDEKERQAALEMEQEGVLNKKEFDHTAYVKGSVGRTFDYYKTEGKELEFDLNKDPFNMAPKSRNRSGTSPTDLVAQQWEETLPFKFHPNEFDAGHWFYDTPGVIHDQQVLTKLTLEELKAVIPGRVIQPKTLTLKPGHSFFLAGLGRLDYLEGNVSVYFTVFTCKRLPIRVVPTQEADEFYQEHAGYKYLEVPIGGADRMKTFPAMKSEDFQVTGIGWNESAADILFSSAGWASVTAGQGMNVQLRAYTPGGNGCLLRQPALLPFGILMRGKRVKGTPYYGVIKDRLVRYL